MSYVHCPSCQRAFDARTQARCPSCQRRLGRAAVAADVEAEIAEATAQLARALARATPAQLAALTVIEPEPDDAAAVSATERWAAIVVAGLGRAVAEETGGARTLAATSAADAATDAPTSASTALATAPPPTIGSLAQSLVTEVLAALLAPLRASGAPDLARRAAAVVERVRAVISPA